MTGLENEPRYLITFDDGGSGMRTHPKPLEAGDTIEDGGSQYVVVTVEPSATDGGFGRVWAERMMSNSDRRSDACQACTARRPAVCGPSVWWGERSGRVDACVTADMRGLGTA